MVQNIIDVKNLSKSFDISSKEPGLKGTIKHFFRRQTKSLKVIKDISFEITEGEIVGFLGANGAKKLIHKEKNIHLNYSQINFHDWTIALVFQGEQMILQNFLEDKLL